MGRGVIEVWSACGALHVHVEVCGSVVYAEERKWKCGGGVWCVRMCQWLCGCMDIIVAGGVGEEVMLMLGLVNF